MRLIKQAIDALLILLGIREPLPTHARERAQPVVELKQWDGPGRPPPLMWKGCHPRTRPIFKAELTCPNGHGVSLRGHAINASGKVSPSVVCLTPGCSFHEFVRLEKWSAGAI